MLLVSLKNCCPLFLPIYIKKNKKLIPILFVIFVAYSFYINNNRHFVSYADDTTLYVCGWNFSEVIDFLESNITNVFKWIHQNDWIPKSSKSHFLISPYETKSIQMQNLCIEASFPEELLGTKIDSNMTFHEHITSLCSKANKN